MYKNVCQRPHFDAKFLVSEIARVSTYNMTKIQVIKATETDVKEKLGKVQKTFVKSVQELCKRHLADSY